MCRSPRAAPYEATNKSPQQPRRHPVTAAAGARAATALGSGEAAATAVCLLRQPKLRQVFEDVFECTTASGNNQWMRGKLLQALGFNSHWQPEPEQQDGQQQAQAQAAVARPACPRRQVCPSAVRRFLVYSSEDSAQTRGAASTWPSAVLHGKRANPGLADSPSSKRQRGPDAAAPAEAAAAAAAAVAASGSHTSDAGPSSLEGQLRQHMPPAAWRQALAHYTANAAGSLSAQDALLWPAPSLHQLLSPQHSAASSSSVDAAVQTALGLLGWGCLPASGGMVACHTLNPAAIQLLALHGADLAFVWQPQAAAQQYPAWWAVQGACGAAGPHPAPTAALDEGAAGSCQPSFQSGQQVAAGAAHQHVQLAQQQQQQQQQQRFLVGLPDAAAADHLPEPAAAAGFAFTPAPLEQPPPLPQHWYADSRGSGSSAAAVAPLQHLPTLDAATAAAAVASTCSISFPPPSSLARRSPFAARPAAPPAAAGRAAALAPMPSLLPAAVPAAAEQAPVRDAARVCQDVRALFDLPEDTPLNDDLLCMYISWNDEGAASLHL